MYNIRINLSNIIVTPFEECEALVIANSFLDCVCIIKELYIVGLNRVMKLIYCNILTLRASLRDRFVVRDCCVQGFRL